MNNKEKPCIPNPCDPTYDLLRQFSLLKSLMYFLEHQMKLLGLKDLVDVNSCMTPEVGQVLTYDGKFWDAKDSNTTDLTIEPKLDEGHLIAIFTLHDTEYRLYESNDKVIVTPTLTEGTEIATIQIGDEVKTLYCKDSNNVLIRPLINGNNKTKIAEVEVDGEQTDLYVPKVQVTQGVTSGTVIGVIKVGDTSTTLYAPNIAEGTGSLENIKINEIDGTVRDKVAELTLTGGDINVTGFNLIQYDDHNAPGNWSNNNNTWYNEELKIDDENTVNESLSKLLQAILDDEFVCNRAFYALQKYLGFTNNLALDGFETDGAIDYIDPSILSKNLFSDWKKNSEVEARLNVKALLSQIIIYIRQLYDTVNGIQKRSLEIKGVTLGTGTPSSTFKLIPADTDLLQANAHTLIIPPTAFINLSYANGIVAQYGLPGRLEFYNLLGYPTSDMSDPASKYTAENNIYYLAIGSAIKPGTFVTFATTSLDNDNHYIFETYQYIGEITESLVSYESWSTPTSWKLINL